MPGRKPTVEQLKKIFLKETASARRLVAAVQGLQISPTLSNGLYRKQVRQVVELAFMGMEASWEEFLEGTLVRYLSGARTGSGYKPSPKFGIAKSITHAYQILAQDAKFDPKKKYLRANDGNWVHTQAEFHFQSHPFGALKTKAQLLDHAVAIRNRVAHSSAKCRADFKATAVHFLNPSSGNLTQGYAPGDLLLAPVVRHFGSLIGVTHFEAYAQLLEGLASQIVP